MDLRVIACFVTVIISSFFLGFPYEQKLLRFSTFKEAFKYNFPRGSIFKSFEGDDYVYLLYKTKNNEVPDFLIHYVKEGNRWPIVSSFYGESKQNRSSIVNHSYIVKINKITDNNMAVLVTYIGVAGEPVKVDDSIGSSFETFPITKESSKSVHYASITIIDKKIDNDYTITIDGYEYAPFKDKNGDKFFRF